MTSTKKTHLRAQGPKAWWKPRLAGSAVLLVSAALWIGLCTPVAANVRVPGSTLVKGPGGTIPPSFVVPTRYQPGTLLTSP